MALVFIEKNCIGCRLCQLACSAQKEGVFNPGLARLKVVSSYNKTGLDITSNVCSLCLACVETCPVEAITVTNGHLVYNQADCTNCHLCVDACPEHVIQAREAGVAVCDLCQGSPACVEWCPHEALINGEAI